MNSFCDINLWFRKFNTTTDILYGRNQSCRALKKNFNVPHGVYYIHPWRDERKIKVDCFGKILIDWLIEFFSTTYGWTMSLCILSIFTSFFKIYRKTEKHYVSIFFARYGLCANFLIHIILKFQDSYLRRRINTKPNGKQKWGEDRKRLLISHQSLYKKNRGLRTDHKQVKNIET